MDVPVDGGCLWRGRLRVERPSSCNQQSLDAVIEPVQLSRQGWRERPSLRTRLLRQGREVCAARSKHAPPRQRPRSSVSRQARPTHEICALGRQSRQSVNQTWRLDEHTYWSSARPGSAGARSTRRRSEPDRRSPRASSSLPDGSRTLPGGRTSRRELCPGLALLALRVPQQRSRAAGCWAKCKRSGPAPGWQVLLPTVNETARRRALTLVKRAGVRCRGLQSAGGRGLVGSSALMQ